MKATMLSSLASSFPTVEVAYEDMLFWPYLIGGRDANGIDCGGVVLEILRRAGLGLPDFKTVGVFQFQGYWDAIDDPSELYDMVQIRREDEHIGIVVRSGIVLSATRWKNVYATRISALKRIDGAKFWRLKPEVLP
jgi:hypothetical protein